MADKTYATVNGFVQFEPKERDANGQNVRDIAIKPANGDPNKLIRVTLWPEFDHAPVEQGDAVMADGAFSRSTYTASDGSKKESLQINASKLNVNGKRYDPQGREVVSADESEAEDLF